MSELLDGKKEDKPADTKAEDKQAADKKAADKKPADKVSSSGSGVWILDQ